MSVKATCRCGSSSMELIGPPIMAVACFCTSCSVAAKIMSNLPESSSVESADGSIHYIIQRKDRVENVTGRSYLREFRLKPKSTTRRVVATCCNSPMFAEFQAGHWLSIYADRVEETERFPIEYRTMLADREDELSFDDDIPSYKRHSAGFMWTLLRAWIAMGFKTPKVDFIEGTLDMPRDILGEGNSSLTS